MEPGRAIAANAGVLLTTVEFLKPTEHKSFAIIDAAMNDLIRPSLYGAWMDIVPVTPRSDDTPDAGRTTWSARCAKLATFWARSACSRYRPVTCWR
jgi:diaminopimelate decarboxylase